MMWPAFSGPAHRLLQDILAPGSTQQLEATLREAMGPSAAGAGPWLDVGAGSQSRLNALGRRPVVVDISPAQARAAYADGALAVVASIEALPFPDRYFDVSACVGLLHHLPDRAAAAGLKELVRVTHGEGRVIVFDAVLPERKWRRPAASAIRALDRGRWMRRQAALEQLLPADEGWSMKRMTYAATGLEGVLATRGGAGVCP